MRHRRFTAREFESQDTIACSYFALYKMNRAKTNEEKFVTNTGFALKC